MAAEVSSMPVNGNYAPHQGYGGIEQQHNNHAFGNNTASSQSGATQPPPASTTPATSTSTQSDIPKDEVGWYFVEQYYTTLSRSPEKLYMFYQKRSQFVSGQETDKVQVCVGQRAINDRIKELDFQECKVRVTNVDSQASDSNIVIQVIGEISNKHQPHKKFTQTFVLATQTNGYFVLNDIFRYLIEEEDEPEHEVEPAGEDVQQAEPAAESGYKEPVPTATAVEPKTLTSSLDPAAIEHDAQQVDRELEDKVLKDEPKTEEAAQPTVNGVAAATEPEVAHAEDAPDAAAVEEESEEPAVAESTQPDTKDEDLKAEKPKDPEPSPLASPPKDATPQTAPAAKPAAPKSWAALVGANKAATPQTPSTASSNTSTARPAPTPAPAASKPAAPATSTPAPPVTQIPPTAPAAQRDESPAAGSQDEWNTVGGSHNRQQSRQANTFQQPEGPQVRGYIKNVHEGIEHNELKAELEKHGEVVYLDVSRPKNSAFVEFKTPEGYNAAVAANPHTVSGERLFVEERKFRPGTGPYPRGGGQFQNNRGRGGAGQGQPRGNFQGRGGFQQRGGRGGPQSAPRGRGGAQTS